MRFIKLHFLRMSPTFILNKIVYIIFIHGYTLVWVLILTIN